MTSTVHVLTSWFVDLIVKHFALVFRRVLCKNLEEIFMPDVLSNVMLLDAFGLIEIFCWDLEAIHFFRAGRRTHEEGPIRSRS